MLEQIVKYRQLGTLTDGTRVLLRPLVKEDKEKLIELFAPTPPEDLMYLQDDVTDRELVGSWADNIDYKKVLPLVAVVNERIVGDATLHFRKGPARHIAEVRIFLSKEFRRRGLGTLMLKTLIDLARRFGLQQLVAEVVASQVKVIKAFQSLGFQLRCTLEDYFILPDGETQDVAILILRLVPRKEEF
ncbi:MAG: GNAT family N-acetyltransferase [Anaerolineae bacterium]